MPSAFQRFKKIIYSRQAQRKPHPLRKLSEIKHLKLKTKNFPPLKNLVIHKFYPNSPKLKIKNFYCACIINDFFRCKNIESNL